MGHVYSDSTLSFPGHTDSFTCQQIIFMETPRLVWTQKSEAPDPSAIMEGKKAEEPTRLCLFREKADAPPPRPTELHVSVMES